MLAPGFLGMGFVAAFGSGTGLGMRTLLLVMFVAGALLIALILWPTDLRVSLARPNADRFVAVFRVPQGPFRRPIWVSEPVGASECALVIEPPNEQELQEAARHEDVRLDAPKPEEHWATLMLGERRILIACGLPAKLRRHGAVEKLAAFGVPVREVTVRRPMPEL